MQLLTRFAGLFLFTLAMGAGAQESPAGLWRSFDDITGKPQALVRIVLAAGEASGRIEQLFLDPAEDPNPRCVKCEGARKDQPILGMTILWGLKPTRNSDENEYTGGEILDPDSGTVYQAILTVVDGGKRLKVRGYFGISLFGRSQAWERVE